MTERIAAHERLLNLDVLRGIAILLILLMNMPYMGDFATDTYFLARLRWSGVDQAAWWLHQILDGTQRGLLELLFGAGVLIMARAAMTPNGPVAVADLHYRRNLWLAAFGVANGLVLLWPGDILLSYAAAALLIFPFRVLSVRQLLIVGVAMTLVMQGWNVAEYFDRVDLAARVAAGDASAAKDWAAAVAAVSPPDPRAVEAARAVTLSEWISTMQAFWVFVQFTQAHIFWENWAEAFATMLIGMALYKTGILQGRASQRTYWLLLLCGFGVGIALRAEATLTMLRFDPAPRLGMFRHSLARLPMTLGHIGALTLLLTTRPGARLLAPFTATGKLPLTTYLGASAVAAIAFSPMFDLWGRLAFAELAGLAFAFMGVQLIGANLWLRHFATGPVEWLWKSLAYNCSQPFRQGDPLTGTAATS